MLHLVLSIMYRSTLVLGLAVGIYVCFEQVIDLISLLFCDRIIHPCALKTLSYFCVRVFRKFVDFTTALGAVGRII